MNCLENKKILLFTPFFFNYHEAIKQELERQGAIVHMYDERNHPSDLEKVLIRKFPILISSKINSSYQLIIETERTFKPDFVLFINPEAVTARSLQLIRQTFPCSRLILYMWDSLENKDFKSCLQYFDEKYSFDPNDCKVYGMKFRQLFYVNGVEKNQVCDFKYDVSFIGTVHSDRAKILLDVKKYCDEHHLKYYFYLYIPGKTMLLFRKLFTKGLREWESKYVHTEPIPKSRIDEISSRTKCIIDINHPYQTGLTMRTIEMVGLKRKLMTTNANITEYDFYRPENQIVLDRKNLKLNIENINSDYIDIPEEVYQKYSLEYWVREIFSCK